jgi:glucoamylase
VAERGPEPQGEAPGQPGIAPTWTSSAKDMVGCSLGRSRIWFTLGFGIVNEVYYPRVDSPQIRDLGFIVADGVGFWSEVKRLQNYSIRLLAPGTPAVEIVHRHDRFDLTLRITPDPDRDVLIIAYRLDGDAALKPYVLLAPRLGMTGHDNAASIVSHGARRLLACRQGDYNLALAAVDETQADGFGQASAGYVGESDGWQDFDRNGALTWHYRTAGPGNVALIGEIARAGTLGLGFGESIKGAGTLAVSSIVQPFDNPLRRQVDDWSRWHARRDERSLMRADVPADLADQMVLSAMVLRAHRDKTYSGTMVASLSVPWGSSGDNRGGYHLVWPRDLVQCATALLALGAEHEARETLCYLIATQKEEGSWNQNQWLDGTPYWQGVQLDETAFPVLLAAMLQERNALHGIAIGEMVRRALGFLARSGPSSAQDRWEENAGINVFTLSICISALVAGAPYLDPPTRRLALALADFWNANLETWTSVGGTMLARRLGIERYYVRLAPGDVLADPSALHRNIEIKNNEPGRTIPADEEVSIDFLAAVRLGLRDADDAVVRDSVAIADALLKVDTPKGPVWHRYNGDGYGEHDDGRPFDGTGRGRGWPLLTGERGYYELMRGSDPLPYLQAMAAMTGPGGMMPEQVWDADPLPDQRLLPGLPTGSAMPLAWAHAEFVKLMVSWSLGRPVDRPSAVWERYGGRRPAAKTAVWCLHAPINRIARGTSLLLALAGGTRVRWSTDGWGTASEVDTQATGFGLYTTELDAAAIGGAQEIEFTFRWSDADRWIGENFRVEIAS